MNKLYHCTCGKSVSLRRKIFLDRRKIKNDDLQFLGLVGKLPVIYDFPICKYLINSEYLGNVVCYHKSKYSRCHFHLIVYTVPWKYIFAYNKRRFYN